MSDRELLVYVDLAGGAHLVGRLWARHARNLIQRDERRRAQAEARQLRSLGEVDFLLGVGDIARQGALRFKDAADGPFLASSDGANVPPLIRLGELLNAAMRVAANGHDDNDLRLILAPGSSLGRRARQSLRARSSRPAFHCQVPASR